MVEAETFKKAVREIITQQIDIEFLGNDFDSIVQKLSVLYALT